MRPLVIIAGLAARHRAPVRQFALRLGAPVYAEPLSGLREDAELDPLLVRNERMLSRGGFDSVIRIGNVPTLRFWRDLTLPVTHYGDLPFTGMPGGAVMPIEDLPPRPPKAAAPQEFLAEDRRKAEEFGQILDAEPQSELAMVRTLSRDIPRAARVYLGNSLPIREWDLAATREPREFTVEANRGANGIDGQLSTFFGWCDPEGENWCIVGDLTAIYDANAPWVVPQLEAAFRIVIINNGGGRMFERVAALQRMDAAVRERLIENVHELHFEQWAASWGIADHVVELRPDLDASRRAWERYDRLWL